MDKGVFEFILKVGKINNRAEYSEVDAKKLDKALRQVVTQYPYNRQTTKASLLAVARFFRTCKGFTVEEWQPSAAQETSKETPPVNPRVRELRERIMRALQEVEKRGSGQG